MTEQYALEIVKAENSEINSKSTQKVQTFAKAEKSVILISDFILSAASL